MRIYKNKEEIASYIDHTILRPDATIEDMEKLCKEAILHGFASVCINPSYICIVSDILRGTKVKVCTVVGFPLGATITEVKSYEAAKAIENGAEEIDMVINIGALKDGKYDFVENDIRAVSKACENKALLKVIIETCLLDENQKIKACQIAMSAGADYVKTSTGFSVSGATVSDVALMRKTVGNNIGVKASGGIRDLATMIKMIENGATRIGTSSSVKIMQEVL